MTVARGGAGEILILFAAVSEQTSLGRGAWDALSVADQARALAITQPLARKQFVAGRALALRAAARLGAEGGMSVAGAEGEKPRLEGAGGLELSISHSHHLVAAAVSAAGPVGLDVELLRAVDPALLAPHFTEAQASALIRQNPEESASAWLGAWCAKEAAAKYLGAQQVLDVRQLPTASCARFDIHETTLVLAEEIYFLRLAHDIGAGGKIQLKKESTLE